MGAVSGDGVAGDVGLFEIGVGMGTLVEKLFGQRGARVA
jgi:hypothetical protein